MTVLAEVMSERYRQDAKWGEQNHPDGTGYDVPLTFGASCMGGLADVARRVCQRRASEGKVTYLDILFEEVAEAFAEDDPAKLRGELVQVAAVAVAWVEAIDRRAGR